MSKFRHLRGHPESKADDRSARVGRRAHGVCSKKSRPLGLQRVVLLVARLLCPRALCRVPCESSYQPKGQRYSCWLWHRQREARASSHGRECALTVQGAISFKLYSQEFYLPVLRLDLGVQLAQLPREPICFLLHGAAVHRGHELDLPAVVPVALRPSCVGKLSPGCAA